MVWQGEKLKQDIDGHVTECSCLKTQSNFNISLYVWQITKHFPQLSCALRNILYTLSFEILSYQLKLLLASII